MRTKIILLAFLTLPILVFQWGCKPYQSEEKLRKVDSLITKVKEVESEFKKININTLKDRYDTIERIKKYLKKNLKKKPKNDLESRLVRFEGISNNYSNFIENYELIRYENEKHLKRLKSLKKDVVEENIQPKRYDSIYKSEKKIIQNHFNRASKLIQSVTKIENNYRRSHKKLKAVYKRLKTKESNQN